MSEIQMTRNNENNILMPNDTKEINRFQMDINSIEQKRDSIWDRYSNIYSNFLIRFSWIILIISLFITIGLSIWFLCFMRIRSFDQTDFYNQNGQALRNAQQIKNIFGNDVNLRVHQQMDLYPALDIIIKRKLNNNQRNMSETNMLNQEIIQEVHLLDEKIQLIRINNNSNNSLQYNFSSLCAKINHACVIDGNYLLSNKFRQDASHLPYIPSGIYFDSLTGANGIASFIFGKNYQRINATAPDGDYDEVEEEEEEENNDIKKPTEVTLTDIISYVPLFRLRYSLNISNNEMHALAIQWERKVSRFLNEKFQSSLITVSPSVSTAITDAVSKQAHDEGSFMTIMVIIFFILVCVSVSIQGNFHTSVGYLSLCGIINFILSSGATFGLLTIIRIQIIEPMALTVFVVAIIDCMRFSIVCGEYHRIINEHVSTSTTTSNVLSEIDIEEILPLLIKSTRPYFLSSTLIITIVYIILSIISPMSCTRFVCLTFSLYIVVNYLTYCTFFSSCFVITLKRIQSRRHCLSCLPLSNDYYMKTREKTNKTNFCQTNIKSIPKIDSIFKKFLTGFLCLLSFIFIISSICLILSIDTRLFDDKFLPKNAFSLRSYMKSQVNDFSIGPVVMFTIPEPIDYQNENTQLLIHRLIEQCQNEITINDFKLVWIEQENIKNIIHGKDPIDLRITPYSQNDLIVLDGKNKSTIMASRFYCQYKSIKGDREDIRTMNNMYTYAHQSSLSSIFPYSLVFPHYESLAQIRIEVYLSILFLVIITFLLTLLFFISFEKAFLLFFHLLALLSGSLACLYLFHNLTFNFPNALWLYIIPVLYLDTLVHSSYHMTKSKWKYNRVILSLIVSLILFFFFPIETYVYQIIHYSLIYQSILCLILINFILPSWYYIIERIFKKTKNEKMSSPIILDTNQSITSATESCL